MSDYQTPFTTRAWVAATLIEWACRIHPALAGELTMRVARRMGWRPA